MSSNFYFKKMIMKMINVFYFIFCLFFVDSNTSHKVDGMRSTPEEDLEFERQLKLINKPSMKTIHTMHGHIVDCINIEKQPAFDHPLLKNHELQRKPSFQRIMEKSSMNNSPGRVVFGLEKNQCPIGTVPIRRTVKDDLIRAKSFLNNPILTQNNDVHVAQITLERNPDDGPYYGVSGTNSVYNPTVNKDQTSESRMWVQNGQGDGINTIVVGWQVSPQLYGDNLTYIYLYWTSDNSTKTGFYNLLCPGFVQIDNEFHIGGPVDGVSVYDGEIVELPVSLKQDPNTKNWWVIIASKNIGYFPGDLFSNMVSAEQVGWGGRTFTPVGTRSPPMGSGHFPDANFVHACYFRYVAFQNDSRQDYGPLIHNTQKLADTPNCFDVKYYGDLGRQVGRSLQFGGPGGVCGN